MTTNLIAYSIQASLARALGVTTEEVPVPTMAFEGSYRVSLTVDGRESLVAWTDTSRYGGDKWTAFSDHRPDVVADTAYDLICRIRNQSQIHAAVVCC